MACHGVIIAGTHSGVGKTTVALGLMAALRQRGLQVQPFKVGPDFIDPGHHTAVCDRVSRNLDTWMLPEATVLSTFARATAGADVAVIEGVMGLFDGRRHDDPGGSTADVARLLGLPVLLVVDAEAVAGSVAAVVKGFSEFDPAVRVIAVVCNQVAGRRHYQEYLEPAIRRHTSVVPLGWLPRQPEWHVPERHLGLTTVEDCRNERGRWDQLGQALQESTDIDQLLALVQMNAGPIKAEGGSTAASPRAYPPANCGRVRVEDQGIMRSRRRLAVARDAAFCFYYPENLELLEAVGGEIVSFSPLRDAALPEGTAIIYLGGGYPELHARALAENASMRRSIGEFHEQGGTIYAECGGLIYACRELVDAEGTAFPMLDLLPARTVMQPRLAALGYVTLRTTRPTPLGPAGTTARGHEYHYSRLEALESLTYAADLDDGRDKRLDGLVSGNLLAGYAHLHFGSNPALADALLGSSSINDMNEQKNV